MLLLSFLSTKKYKDIFRFNKDGILKCVRFYFGWTHRDYWKAWGWLVHFYHKQRYKTLCPNCGNFRGLGSFEPRKPLIENIAFYDDKGVEYFIKDPEVYRNKRVVISGEGDSALDWAIFWADVASEVILIQEEMNLEDLWILLIASKN